MVKFSFLKELYWRDRWVLIVCSATPHSLNSATLRRISATKNLPRDKKAGKKERRAERQNRKRQRDFWELRGTAAIAHTAFKQTLQLTSQVADPLPASPLATLQSLTS